MTATAVLVHPLLTVPPALALVAGLVWYWLRVGHRWRRTPRRGVRRLSIALIVVSLPPVVRGLSFSDPDREGIEWAVTWAVATMLIFAVVMIGALDAMLTYRVHRREYDEALRRARQELTQATDGHRGADMPPREPAP